MELDMKHKNIGATSSMKRILHRTLGDVGVFMTQRLTELFDLEAKECDFQMEGMPGIIGPACDHPNNHHNICGIDCCPLGLETESEFEAEANVIDFKSAADKLTKER
jgi:hypothetical protein